MSSTRTIHALLVRERSSGKFVAVFGADSAGEAGEKGRTYDLSPYDFYAVSRPEAAVADYLVFDDHPDLDATAQEWAEYIWKSEALG